MISPVRDWRLIGTLAVFGAVFALMGIACVYGWHAEYREHKLRKSGIETQAVVLNSESRARKAPAILQYQFKHDGHDYIDSWFVSSSAQRRHGIGATIIVRYLPDEPNFSRPVGLENPATNMIYRLGLVMMTGVIVTLLASLAMQLRKGKRIMKSSVFWTKPKLRRPVAKR
jgi:hypothetical protein